MKKFCVHFIFCSVLELRTNVVQSNTAASELRVNYDEGASHAVRSVVGDTDGDHVADSSVSDHCELNAPSQSVAGDLNTAHIPQNVDRIIKRTLSSSRLKTRCELCGNVMLRKNLPRHIKRQHDHSPSDISIVNCVLVDKCNGIFMCAKSQQGSTYPIHVKLNITAGVQEVFCEDTNCQEAARVAGRCNFASFMCPHLKSLAAAVVLPDCPVLSKEILQNLVRQKMIKESGFAAVVSLYEQALSAHCVPVSFWQPSNVGQFCYLSVYTSDVSHYSRLKRVIVRFDNISCQFDCACSPRKQNCNHKKMAQWYIAQEKPELMHAFSPDVDLNESSDVDVTEHVNDVPQLSATTTSMSELSVLDRLDLYTQPRYRIPTDLTAVVVPGNICIIEPPDSRCPICDGSLSTSLLTKHGKMYDVDRCLTGNIL